MNLNENFEYRRKYDVFLAAPFSVSETNGERFNFYERAEKPLRDIGKRMFIPHRNISPEWKKETYEILLERIMPFCDLVMGDIEIPSQFTRYVACFAFRMEIPIIYFCRTGTEFDMRLPRRPVLCFNNEKQGMQSIRGYLKEFYEINGFQRL